VLSAATRAIQETGWLLHQVLQYPVTLQGLSIQGHKKTEAHRDDTRRNLQCAHACGKR
jgi:hypothetical protein